MIVKMFEYFQGTDVKAILLRTGSEVNILVPDEVYKVDNVLGSYLVDNRKATETDEKSKVVHYGAQKEPEYPRNDDIVYSGLAQTDESPLPESTVTTTEDEAVMTTPIAKKTRKSKGEK